MASMIAQMTRTETHIDLRQTAPRPLDAELEGYAWLPRMFDKARATLAGAAGDYMFGCPVDHTCMARLGVTPAVILELASRHAGDGELLAALKARGIPDAGDAWFDAPAVEEELQERGTYIRVRRVEQLSGDDAGQAFGRAFQGGEHGARVSVAILELPPGACQPLHSHPVEEVLVVTRGQARVTLGDWQARLIGAGEIARIPAGEVHSLTSSGEEPLQAVAAYGTPSIETTLAAERV